MSTHNRVATWLTFGLHCNHTSAVMYTYTMMTAYLAKIARVLKHSQLAEVVEPRAQQHLTHDRRDLPRAPRHRVLEVLNQ